MGHEKTSSRGHDGKQYYRVYQCSRLTCAHFTGPCGREFTREINAQTIKFTFVGAGSIVCYHIRAVDVTLMPRCSYIHDVEVERRNKIVHYGGRTNRMIVANKENGNDWRWLPGQKCGVSVVLQEAGWNSSELKRHKKCVCFLFSPLWLFCKLVLFT